MSSDERRRGLSPGSDVVLRSKSNSTDPFVSADAASRSNDEGKLTTARFRDDFLFVDDRDGRIVLAERSSDLPESTSTEALRLFNATGVRTAALLRTIRVGIFL